MSALPRRGEIWWCSLADAGRRPVMVLTRDAAIPRLRASVVAPCTTTIRGIPSEVVLEPDANLVPRTTAVNLDAVRTVAMSALEERIAVLRAARIHDICAALAVAVGCDD